MSRRIITGITGEITPDTEIIAGRNVISEALKSDRVFRKIFIEENVITKKEEGQGYSNDTRINDIILLARKRHIATKYVLRSDVKEVEEKILIPSEGIIAIVEKREEMTIRDALAHCTKKNKEPFFIIVNNILYEENLGAILRTAAAGGVDAIILPKRDKRFVTPNVARISMGGSEHVPVVRDNLFEVLQLLTKEAIKIVGVELSGTKYYYDEPLSGPLALLLGGEDAGVTDPLLKKCDVIVKIPLLGSIQSLNVSVSTGILIYEKVRQECQS
jgi:23S rRNA (guanosine2251-2'-O)-methyltransferase